MWKDFEFGSQEISWELLGDTFLPSYILPREIYRIDEPKRNIAKTVELEGILNEKLGELV